MASCSMMLVLVLNIIAMVCSIAAVISSANVEDEGKPCVEGVAHPMMQIGTIGIVVGIIGLLGSFCRSRGIQYIYLWMLLVSTISSVVFFVFIWGMLPELNAYLTFNKHIKGFWLDGYSPMLQKALVNDKNWYEVSNCLWAKAACDVYKIHIRPLNHLQNGCCTPPNRCGLEIGNSTASWVEAPTGLLSDDDGCKKWVRYGGYACFECDECKAGYLANFHAEWVEHFNLNVGMLIFAVMLSAISYYAIKVEKREDEEEEEQELNKMSSRNISFSHQRL